MMEPSSRQPSIGIRRESKNRWERRCALAPAHVQQLVKNGIRVVVQPSTLRTYPDRKYLDAGAIIDEDLSGCDLIVGVKEVPVDQLIADKTYMFFSHTIKAQPNNMPLLDEILAKNIRLIDYEKITDGSGQRLVRFGRFAGYAGMVDTLHAIGDRWLALGYSTPFLHLGYSYQYFSLDAAKDAVAALGEELATVGVPQEIGPVIFGFTSNGTSSQGAQEIFKLLPHKWIAPEDVAKLASSTDYDRHIVYGTVIEANHHIVPNDPAKTFDKKEYYSNPSAFHSEFATRFAPHLSVIMNCQYWDSKYPRLITMNNIKELTKRNMCRLVAVGDVSCDPLGSIEFLVRTTSIDAPLFIFDPMTQNTHDQTTEGDWMYKPGILMLGVDNLPTEFPREATTYFGDNLLPFMETIAKSNFKNSYEQMANDLPEEVYRAVITANGKLTTPFEYIAEWRKRNVERDHRVLVLGAGHVSRPCVSYLARDPSNIITIADVSIENAEAVARSVHRSARESDGPVRLIPIKFDVSDDAALSDIVSKHHIVVSLLPRPLNPAVIKHCIAHKKHFVCSSYLSDDIRAYDEDAQKAGVIVLNECGLDPGIDHMSSMELIEEIKSRQGKVKSFISWCGALPAPECSGNPLGYKFSWSPRGMLQAAVADAKYKLLGHEVGVAGQELFKRVQPVGLFPGLALEGVPNRNSIQYMKEYAIEDVHTIFRGTLRYKGFAEVMEALVDLGLLDEKTKLPYLDPSAPKITWADFMTKFLDPKGQSGKTPEQLVKDHLRPPAGFPSLGFEIDKLNRVIEAFDFLGFFSTTNYVHQKHTCLDALCPLLENVLAFDHKVDWDAVIMHHIVDAEFPNGQTERHNMTFSAYGKIGGPSAISLTVGLAVAIAADLVLDGTITSRGVLGPMKPDIFVPVMKALKDEGFRFVHRVKSFPTSQNVIA